MSPLELLGEIYFALCKGVDTPVSLACWLRFKHREHAQLAEKSVHPNEYNTADSFSVDYMVTNFVRKNKDLVTGIDVEAEAIRSFELSEAKCLSTNERIKERSAGRYFDPAVERVISRAQRKIASLLGSPHIDKWLPLCAWGPGATDDLSRPTAYLDTKHVRLPLTVTRRAFPYAVKSLLRDRHWREAILNELGTDFDLKKIFKIVPGGKHDTVPKDATKNRNIEKNPRMNIWLQKGLGAYIRKRLKRVGIDLNDQSHNQGLAWLANIMDLSTLDLRNASDSIATEVVYLLLPIDWALLLDDMRTSEMRFQGKWIHTHRFSSMGNGFTFELESLIFWSIVSSVEEEHGRRVFGVYGDDLICHKECVPQILEVLSSLGFELNASKSFVDGQFFESCGEHFYGGYNVTPIYQKKSLSSLDELIRCGNRLLRFAARSGLDYRFDPRIRPAYECVARRIDFRHYGPFSLERDDYLSVPREQLGSRFCPNRGYQVVVRSEVIPRVPANDDALFSLYLHGAEPLKTDKEELLSQRVRIPPWDAKSRSALSVKGKPKAIRTQGGTGVIIREYDEDSGTLPSRSKGRAKLRNSNAWVYPSVGMHLNW